MGYGGRVAGGGISTIRISTGGPHGESGPRGDGSSAGLHRQRPCGPVGRQTHLGARAGADPVPAFAVERQLRSVGRARCPRDGVPSPIHTEPPARVVCAAPQVLVNPGPDSEPFRTDRGLHGPERGRVHLKREVYPGRGIDEVYQLMLGDESHHLDGSLRVVEDRVEDDEVSLRPHEAGGDVRQGPGRREPHLELSGDSRKVGTSDFFHHRGRRIAKDGGDRLKQERLVTKHRRRSYQGWRGTILVTFATAPVAFVRCHVSLYNPR